MNVLLYLAEAILIAYFMRRISLKLKIPAVSGYVIGGVLLGGSLFLWHPGGRSFREQWLFTRDVLSQMVIITQIALGLIALSIGAELEFKVLKSLGKSVISITLMGALIPFIMVVASVLVIWKDMPLALILGAVATATAPAATIAVIQQYRAKGPLTSTIVAVVGLDDGVSFVVFAFFMTLVKGMFGSETVNVVNSLLIPMGEIAISIVLGAVVGFVAARMLMGAKDQESAEFILVFLILLVSGIAMKLNVSELLANMTAGTVLVNVNPFLKKKIRVSFSSFTPIFYALFFIIGGAHLDLSSITYIWHIGLIYFLARALGKISGASLGAAWGNALPQVRKYIGISLLPQVGAAVALALVVEQEFGGGQYGGQGISLARTTFNILLVTTFFTEFIGPYMTKLAIFRAGEARETG